MVRLLFNSVLNGNVLEVAFSQEKAIVHCYFLRGIDNGSGHLALRLVSQSIFNVDNSMLDCGNVVMFCCWPKPSSKDMSPVQAGPLSVIFLGS